jgi:hypothetical protein
MSILKRFWGMFSNWEKITVVVYLTVLVGFLIHPF